MPSAQLVEPVAAAVEHNVFHVAPGESEDVADGGGALRLADANFCDIGFRQAGQPCWRQRRQVKPFGRFRNEREGQRFHGSKILQMIEELAELAAIIAGGDAGCALLRPEIGDSLDAGFHRCCNCIAGLAVDDDFQHRIDVRSKLALDDAAQGGCESLVGRRDHALVLAADLGTRTHNTAGERQDGARHVIDRGNGCFRRSQCLGVVRQAATNCRRPLPPWSCRSKPHREFAVHHRNPPEMPAAEFFGDLPAIAEIAQRRAELQLRRPIEAGETGAAGRW